MKMTPVGTRASRRAVKSASPSGAAALEFLDDHARNNGKARELRGGKFDKGASGAALCGGHLMVGYSFASSQHGLEQGSAQAVSSCSVAPNIAR
jgi:hypothetical protein